MPVEHGAWGILLVPLLCAAALARSWNPPLALSMVCALTLFLLRGSLEAQAPGRGWRAVLAPGHLLLAAAGSAATGILIAFYRRDELIGLGAVAGALYWLQRWLLRKHAENAAEKRNLPAELVGVALLTLTAPAAWIGARGSLFASPAAGGATPTGVKLWLLNLLFFLGGILYVKYRVRGLLAHKKFQGVGERLAFAWPVFLYWVSLAIFLARETLRGWLPALVLLAFVPGAVRAGALCLHLGQRFPIRRLGWMEIVHAAVFGALLILSFRSW